MSILINALPRADLNPTIADPNFKATILAPTNRAFEAALLKLKLTPKQGAGTMFVGASETAKIVAADIAAGQSVIHVVDTVLLPPTKPSQM
ncbi:hypothetical protein Rsub_06991 [Raphidocelis subcapitata]|uniref:FAS1 domain-containing protein n=1 Tax=Raphidocelis subcapitata TaxID=307507 RepID=A0A2V0PBB1_9CHLO|nr:hypothetical protein Rsub_06991 [Raphidocelis subcapitata]|eukprot:GBF94457.1 hypothetical protein Rsub_06991 [Raphidocelis subcapitata]